MNKNINQNNNLIQELLYKHDSLIKTTIYQIIKNKSVAEDAIQEARFKIYNNLLNKGIDSVHSIESWIKVVSKHAAFDEMRKSFHELPMDDEHLNMLNKHEKNKTSQDEDLEEYEQAIRKLNKITQSFMKLRYEGYSIKEISIITSYPVNTVKVKLYRGRKKLMKILKKER